MKYQVMNVDGYNVIIDNDEFIKNGNYSPIPLSLEKVCEIMNKNELYKSKIGEALSYIDNWDMDYSFAKLTKILEETL